MIVRLCFLILLATTPFTVYAESLTIEPKHASFDVATAFSTLHQSYAVTNNGSKPVVLQRWKAITGYGEVIELPKSLAPGESGTIEVDLPLPGTVGPSLHRFALFTDEPDVERYRFTLAGFVVSLISPARPLVDFGTVKATSRAEQKIELSAREKTPLRLVRVTSAPDWLEATIANATVTLRLKPASMLGLHGGVVRVATNLPQQPFVEVTAKAIVEGNLVPSVYAVGLKPIEVGETASTVIKLAYTGKADLSTLRVDAPRGWTTKRSGCTNESSASCTLVTVSKRLTETGRFNDSVNFHIDAEPILSIPFGAIGLGKGQTVHEMILNEKGEAGNAPDLDIGKALVQSAPVAASESGDAEVAPVKSSEKISHSEGRGPVRLHWRARNDGKVFGYMIYRATDRAGPFVRVSEKPVRTQGPEIGTDETRGYEFTDSDVKPDLMYYYYIDAIGSDGSQNRFSPVMSKKIVP